MQQSNSPECTIASNIIKAPLNFMVEPASAFTPLLVFISRRYTYFYPDMYAKHDENVRSTQTYRATVATESTIPISPEHNHTRRLSRHSLHFSSSSALPLPLLLPALDQARVQRRRLQNRASQRAFRERKIRHTEGLGVKLKELAEMHQGLRDAYQRKADEVDTLCARVEKLNGEISMLQVSAECGGEMFSDPNGDYEWDVSKVKNENPLGWSFNDFEPRMGFDWFSIYTDSTPAMSPWGDML